MTYLTIELPSDDARESPEQDVPKRQRTWKIPVESSEEDKVNDKAMVEPEGGKAASVQDQEASEYVYKKPHEISEPSLPTENIYATGGSKPLLSKR